MEKASVTNRESGDFQAILLARIAELQHVLRCRDVIRVEQNADKVDECQQASERALVIFTLDRETLQLREARSALRRIRQGSFGVCEQCGEGIHFKRLLAVPWTALCIQCQEELDLNRRDLTTVHLYEADPIQENEAA